MSEAPSIRTLGQLKASGYHPRSVREEIRLNLLAKLRKGEPLFPGIHGYEDTVIPAVENALLAGQDVLLLGERGQGKSRLIRSLVDLLDEWSPEIAGSEIHDDPVHPVSAYGRETVKKHGDDTELRWVHRTERYGEKLATPDVSTADLVGDVDPMKVVAGRALSDELTMHFGLLPRTNRGIFCINELPDLTEKLQVALFNVMEERDVQIKGYNVRLPLDVLVVASANPEDYTSRGRIVTPLKDRYAAQIRTHYPNNRGVELEIVAQEAHVAGIEGVEIYVPDFMSRIVVETTFQARASPDVSQTSGVSVRVTIANYETLVANALRRAMRHGDGQAVPRVSDLASLRSSIQGKLELEYAASNRGEDEIVDDLVRRAIKTVFDQTCEDAAAYGPIVEAFNQGWVVETTDMTPAREFVEGMDKIEGLREAAVKLAGGDSPPKVASAVEFILEGLHLSNKINKTTNERGSSYGAS
ncbi:MAG: sigma 54-interacting transcriptional regulator [Myxococcales bacterium]|nr:sigma 54-interacting transcriptional regulator [Myxococcales bacterium]MDD9967596.1 sigma 54-interacting transcriptional regulator [Myxococcales bacterium]